MTPYPELRPTEITQISIRAYTVLRLRDLQSKLGLQSYDDVLEHVLRGTTPPNGHAPSGPLPPALRGTYPRCADPHEHEGRRVLCRRKIGHPGRHRWWDKSGSTVEWNRRREAQ